MKRLLLITSFLASQLFAAQCTEKQYEPYVKNNDRYIYSNSSRIGKNFFDKKSVIYDKENQTIKTWEITQISADYTPAIMKVFWEFDIKNNRARVLSEIQHDCNGIPINFDKDNGEWKNISPDSTLEALSNSLKQYLNIK